MLTNWKKIFQRLLQKSFSVYISKHKSVICLSKVMKFHRNKIVELMSIISAAFFSETADKKKSKYV